MDDLELAALFTGYGYQVRFVEYGPLAESDEEEKKKDLDLNVNMAVSFEWAYTEIRYESSFSSRCHNFISLTLYFLTKPIGKSKKQHVQVTP